MEYKDLKDGLSVMIYIPVYPNQFFAGKVNTYGEDGGFYIETVRPVEGHEVYGVVYPDTIDNWFYILPVKKNYEHADYEKGREHFLKNGKYFIGDCIISKQEDRHEYLSKQKKYVFQPENRQ